MLRNISYVTLMALSSAVTPCPDICDIPDIFYFDILMDGGFLSQNQREKSYVLATRGRHLCIFQFSLPDVTVQHTPQRVITFLQLFEDVFIGRHFGPAVH